MKCKIKKVIFNLLLVAGVVLVSQPSFAKDGWNYTDIGNDVVVADSPGTNEAVYHHFGDSYGWKYMGSFEQSYMDGNWPPLDMVNVDSTVTFHSSNYFSDSYDVTLVFNANGKEFTFGATVNNAVYFGWSVAGTWGDFSGLASALGISDSDAKKLVSDTALNAADKAESAKNKTSKDAKEEHDNKSTKDSGTGYHGGNAKGPDGELLGDNYDAGNGGQFRGLPSNWFEKGKNNTDDSDDSDDNDDSGDSINKPTQKLMNAM